MQRVLGVKRGAGGRAYFAFRDGKRPGFWVDGRPGLCMIYEEQLRVIARGSRRSQDAASPLPSRTSRSRCLRRVWGICGYRSDRQCGNGAKQSQFGPDSPRPGRFEAGRSEIPGSASERQPRACGSRPSGKTRPGHRPEYVKRTQFVPFLAQK